MDKIHTLSSDKNFGARDPKFFLCFFDRYTEVAFCVIICEIDLVGEIMETSNLLSEQSMCVKPSPIPFFMISIRGLLKFGSPRWVQGVPIPKASWQARLITLRLPWVHDHTYLRNLSPIDRYSRHFRESAAHGDGTLVGAYRVAGAEIMSRLRF